jgi:hypothetical protein
MACSTNCRTDDAPSACQRRCGGTVRRLKSLLEPDLAGFALIGAQIEMLAALGTEERPRL